MHTTIKSLYIDIEQRIQQITSNRHRSIAPQVYDMVLNSCAIRYIQSKSNPKTNAKTEGFDESKKRVDDLQSLKKSSEFLKVNLDIYGNPYIILPSDYLKIVRSDSTVKFSKFDKTLKDTISKSYKIFSFNIDVFNDILESEKCIIRIIEDGKTKDIDITNIISLIDLEDDEDRFEFVNHLLDILRNQGVNIYWEDFDSIYSKNTFYITNFKDNLEVKIISKNDESESEIEIDLNIKENLTYKNASSNIKPNDLISSENITELRNNYYHSKNRHDNPMSEIKDNRLYIYDGNNFIIDTVQISYIKTPRLFSYYIDQISDLNITPEFIDMVVSDILLILKDGSYQNVKQNINIE